MKVDSVVFDLDGVLANNSGRQEYLTGEVQDWKEFYLRVGEDEVYQPMLNLLDMMFFDMDYEVVILTSRPTTNRSRTLAWLSEHEINFDELIMRPKDNFDPEWKVKEIKKLKNDRMIHYIFEDSPYEIALFRALNWPIIPVLGTDYGREVIRIG